MTSHRDDLPGALPALTPGAGDPIMAPAMALARPVRGKKSGTTTPFARLLIEYSWEQRPPLGMSELTRRIGGGTIRQTVHHWIYNGALPRLEDMFRVLSALGIPFWKLADAYESSGVALPPDLAQWVQQQSGGQGAEAPKPRPYVKPQPPADEWQAMIDATTASMRASGLPDQAIAEVVAHIRQAQSGQASISPHVTREHASPPPTTVPETRPLRKSTRPSTPDKGRSRI